MLRQLFNTKCLSRVPPILTFSNCKFCRAMTQAVSCWALNAEGRVRARVSLCGICGGQSGTGTGFSTISSAFQYHSTVALHTHIDYHLGMDNRPVGGRSSETSSHLIDMNMNMIAQSRLCVRPTKILRSTLFTVWWLRNTE
jgi:hypothetical protein